MKLIDTTGKVYSADKAREVAKQLQDSDTDGWKYVADIKGEFGRVNVYDENGNLVGAY